SNSMSGGNTRVPMPNIPKSPASVVSWGEERSASGGSCRWVRWLDGGDSSGSAQTSTPGAQSGGGAVRGGVAAAGDEGASAGGLRLGGARAVGAFVRVRLPKQPPPGGGRFDETSGRPRSSLARRLPRRSEPLGRSASSRERNEI